MNYDETIRYLYSLRKHGIKFGLQNINKLLSALHNPHKSFLAVHVGGTNGKGSTSAIIASVLQTAGFTVGLFTSPHLISFTERIRVNGEEITENDVINIAAEIRDIASGFDEFSPTFFEVVTAIAMLHFKGKEIDIAVMEVGMGGRLDATNIIMPEVSVITNIGYDHKEFLGDTLGEIAREKAGIIKEDVPVVISYQDREALDVIKMTADEKHADLFLYGRDFSSVLKSENVSGLCFDYRGSDSFAIHDLILPLRGEHQMQNASLAIKAVGLINERSSILTSPLVAEGEGDRVSHNEYWVQCIREGLKNVRWPGRLEYIQEDPPILIDAAHNPAAADALARALKRSFLETYKKIIIILGIMADKDIKGIMEPLLPLASEVILTAPSYSRAASPEHLADIAHSLGFSDLRIAPTVKDAIKLAIRKSYNSSPITHHSPLVLITGSFYTIGEAKEALGQKGVLTRLRE